MELNIAVVAILVYLAISLSVCVLVARTLHRNGRVFLLDSFRGNAPLADSVNHLLVVGFYLVNTGFVAVGVNLGSRAQTAEQALLTVSTNVGAVLLVLGTVHFVNLVAFSLFRKRAMEDRENGRQPYFGETDYPTPKKSEA